MSDGATLYELQRVVEPIGKLAVALRAASLEVIVTTDLAIYFTVRVEDVADALCSQKHILPIEKNLQRRLLTVSHGPNEFVPIRNISQCALIYALTAAEMLH
jgi:hypothetical protein